MSIAINIEVNDLIENAPERSLLVNWAKLALSDYEDDVVLSLLICDENEGRRLNKKFRSIDKATNVLSFPFEFPIGVPKEEIDNYLGDIVICAPIVKKEAIEQSKKESAHWAHIFIHGILHLIGFDHKNEKDSEKMEKKECEILNKIGFSDPYKAPVSTKSTLDKSQNL
tara:strand:+ start:156 stop:662 length:507 start_codon:yes stop_codon:yes gene_type:complete